MLDIGRCADGLKCANERGEEQWCASLTLNNMAHVKTTDGYDVKVPSQGQVTYNTVAGSAGLASFFGIDAKSVLNGWGNRNSCGCASPADMPVTRYEMAMQQEIASKDSKIALLEANTYQDQKSLELYKYVDAKFNSINEVLAAQAVRNAQTECALARERDERCCGDNAIVNYANATFYPKMVADVTVGTTTTAQTVYNPLPNCGCCK